MKHAPDVCLHLIFVAILDDEGDVVPTVLENESSLMVP